MKCPADDRERGWSKQPKIGVGAACPGREKNQTSPPRPWPRVTRATWGHTGPEASPPAGRRGMQIQLGSVARVSCGVTGVETGGPPGEVVPESEDSAWGDGDPVSFQGSLCGTGREDLGPSGGLLTGEPGDGRAAGGSSVRREGTDVPSKAGMGSRLQPESGTASQLRQNSGLKSWVKVD